MPIQYTQPLPCGALALRSSVGLPFLNCDDRPHDTGLASNSIPLASSPDVMAVSSLLWLLTFKYAAACSAITIGIAFSCGGGGGQSILVKNHSSVGLSRMATMPMSYCMSSEQLATDLKRISG